MSESAKPKMEMKPVEDSFELPFERMLNDHIAVVIDSFHYSGKLVIPENAKRQPTKGRVVAVADNIGDIQVGDRILYSQFAGYMLAFEGLPRMRILGYSEVLSILKRETPDILSEGA
jgi:co-chaperonin GroES (HSP10)